MYLRYAFHYVLWTLLSLDRVVEGKGPGSFWSIKIPVKGEVLVELGQSNIVHITKASFSISGSVDQLNGKWARVMVGIDDENIEEGQQVCYLGVSNGLGTISENLNLSFNPLHGKQLKFWLE